MGRKFDLLVDMLFKFSTWVAPCHNTFVAFDVLLIAKLLLQLGLVRSFGVQEIDLLQSKAFRLFDKEIDEEDLQDISDAEQQVELPPSVGDSNRSDLRRIC